MLFESGILSCVLPSSKKKGRETLVINGSTNLDVTKNLPTSRKLKTEDK